MRTRTTSAGHGTKRSIDIAPLVYATVADWPYTSSFDFGDSCE